MIIVLMGVAGAGKTTIGSLLSQKLGWSFVDADGLHTTTNIEKMKSGIALTESDRGSWLDSARRVIQKVGKETNVVFAFPGLTEQHRARVLGNCSHIKIVHLVGTFELIQKRLKQREDHFFPERLLSSQFDILEPPANALTINVAASPEDIVKNIREDLNV